MLVKAVVLFSAYNIYTDNPLLLEYMGDSYIYTTEKWSVSYIIKNIAKAVMLHGGDQAAGAFWFIASLMEISIAYCMIDFFIKKTLKKESTMIVQLCISIIFILIGYVCHLTNVRLWGGDIVFSCYILFHGGCILKKYGISSKERKVYLHLIILIVTCIVLLGCNSLGRVSLVSNYYPNPVFLLIASFCGWQFLYEISFFIKNISIIKSIIVCIGQNSMSVVILHFLAFKIVSYIGVLMKGMPLCLVAAFPILFYGEEWWVAYLCVGIIVPVCLGIAWKKLKCKIVKV